MQDFFITKINIKKVRHLQDINIELSEIERKHLVLTGKNGSGKTSLLEAIRNNIINKQGISSYSLSSDIKNKYVTKGTIVYPGVEMFYSNSVLVWKDMMFVFISANRTKLTVPTAIEPIKIDDKTLVTRNASKDFLKYILNMDYQLYGAKSDGNNSLVHKLEKWFDNFLIALKEIYTCQELELQRDTKKLIFKVVMPNREPFGLHEMADGYAAFLDIYMELLMRFENKNNEVDYDTPAIVLVDEIETHLHVELQKRILPFLTKMFPNVQFIAATHSPFVINSLENAVIFDLEKKTRLENPSFYSYETILESFLDTDMYSGQIKQYFERYKELCFKERTPEENDEFLRAKSELEMKALPSKELYIAFQELEKVRKAEKNGTSD